MFMIAICEKLLGCVIYMYMYVLYIHVHVHVHVIHTVHIHVQHVHSKGGSYFCPIFGAESIDGIKP